MKTKLLAFVAVLTSVLPLYADSSARTILYHSKDIVNIRAKVKYTTLIQLPTTEKIIEVATGDKEFWIIDVVGSFCFVHPAKKDIRSNLNPARRRRGERRRLQQIRIPSGRTGVE